MTGPCQLPHNERNQQCTGNLEQGCKILVIDDDAAMRSLLVDELQERGCRVIEASNGNDALVQLQTVTPDLIITDLKMPGGGFDFFRHLQRTVPGCPIVLITAFGDSQTKAKAQECGVISYMEKPVRIADLKTSLTNICQKNPCRNSTPLIML